MPVVSITLSDEEHTQLKNLADQKGLSVSEWVRQCSIQQNEENSLREFLHSRIQEAERGEHSEASMDEIKREARARFLT